MRLMDRIETASFWKLIVGFLVLVGPLMAAVPVAVLGKGIPIAGFSGLIGVMVAMRIKQREFWKLRPPARKAVWVSQQHGSATGDPRLDDLVRRRLDQEIRARRSNRVAVPVVLAVALAVPVVAAVRASGWWLATEVPAVLAAVVAYQRSRMYDPRQSLAALNGGTWQPPTAHR